MHLTQYVQALSSNLTLKATSCIIGYSLWALLGTTHATKMHYHVPLSFYNVPATYTIEAPEAIDITLVAQRKQLRTLSPETLALHIDGSTLRPGANHCIPTAATLFLPESFEVLHYTPANLTITVKSAPSPEAHELV